MVSVLRQCDESRGDVHAQRRLSTRLAKLGSENKRESGVGYGHLLYHHTLEVNLLIWRAYTKRSLLLLVIGCPVPVATHTNRAGPKGVVLGTSTGAVCLGTQSSLINAFSVHLVSRRLVTSIGVDVISHTCLLSRLNTLAPVVGCDK